MALVPAKCPECGGNINIDPTKKAGICEYCKQPFVVEEAIQNFNTTYNVINNNEIKADVVIINDSLDNKNNEIEELKKKFEFYFNKNKHVNNKEDRLSIYRSLREVIEAFEKKYVKKYLESIEIQKEYFYMLLKCSKYQFEMNIDMPQGGVDLIKVYEDIKYLDENTGKDIENELHEYAKEIYEFTQKNTNYDTSIETLYKAKTLSTKDSRSVIIRNFILKAKGDKYIEIVQMRENMKNDFTKISNIIDRKNIEYIGVSGHYFVTRRYSFDDALICDIGICKECFIQDEELREYVLEVNNGYFDECKRLNVCYKCKTKLSLFGKCTNSNCSNYQKKVYYI